ncbi:MAG: non-canonical purine NTP pyrophosphatase [Candidatus Buchananbacteria bacterium]
MDIILATRNPSKADQIRAVFSGLPVQILTLDEAGIKGEAVEDGRTLQENALKKARFVHEQLADKTLVMADDTGLFINALGGAPGIRSARWAGETATTEEITKHTLAALAGATDRSARFETAVAVIMPDGRERFFNGQVSGQILESPRTAPQPKMPYSGIFVCDGSGLVWAEMTIEHENSISHRGQAFRQARALIEGLL